MTVDTIFIVDPGDTSTIWENPDRINLLDGLIQKIVQDLADRPWTKRVAYDKWEWTNEHELERYATYCFLKYGNEILGGQHE